MKHCENSSNCYLGSCIYKDTCGADIDLTDKDSCPLEVENYEMFLEELIWNKTDESS